MLKTVQSVFCAKASRDKPILSMSEFIFDLSLKQKWGPPDKVKSLLRDAESNGWVRSYGDEGKETVELLICAEAAHN